MLVPGAACASQPRRHQRSAPLCPTLSAYARPTPYPVLAAYGAISAVLTARMALLHATSQYRLRVVLTARMVLPAPSVPPLPPSSDSSTSPSPARFKPRSISYAMSGTDVAYHATVGPVLMQRIVLPGSRARKAVATATFRVSVGSCLGARK
eukprot:3824844-Rhodomonas_salina.4